MRAEFMLSLFAITLLCTANPAAAAKPDSDCVEWFEKGKIKAGSKDCEIDCASLMTDMGTFVCPDQCPALCKANTESSVPENFIYYPGLTAAEKKIG